MKTFKQYVREIYASQSERHGISVAEAMRETPEAVYSGEWREHIVKSFNDGEDIPTRMWRSFDEGLRYRVLRSPRALRDDDLTRELKAKIRPT